jgi:hypothetical protein
MLRVSQNIKQRYECSYEYKDHITQQCPSLPRMKATLQPTDEEAEVVYLLTHRRQW